MQKIAQLINDHKWAILLAFLLGIIITFPQIYFPYHHNQEYQGIYMTCTDNEIFYLNRVREVQDGHPSLGSAVFKDGKDDPCVQPLLGEILTAYLGKIFFLDINNTILLARFVFPFLIFLAIYGFVFLLSKDKLAALSASSAFSLAIPLFARQGLFTLLRGEALETTFLSLFRPVQPQIHFLFFFGFLFFFLLFFDASTRLSAKKQWLWGILSALILGLSFYVYLYAWTFLYVFAGVLILILLWKKRWQEAKKVILISLGGIFIAIPYLLNFYKALLYPSFKDISLRYALLNSHQPILGFLAPAIFIIFLLFFPKKWKEQFLFSLALLITPFLVLNQQLITGRIMATGHYHWHIVRPLAIIFWTIIIFYWSRVLQEKWKFFKNLNKILAVSIIGISIYTGINIQAVSYGDCQSKILQRQRYAPVINWLNNHARKEGVILADLELSDVISMYTSLNLFQASPANYYLSAPNSRMLNIIFTEYRLKGVTAKDAESIFSQYKERSYISRKVFNEYYKDKLGAEAAIPDEVLLSFVKKYQDFLKISLDRLLKIYDVKYVIWDKKNHPQWHLDQYQFFEKIYEKEDFAIYLLK